MDLDDKELKAVKRYLRDNKTVNKVLKRAVAEAENGVENKVIELAKEIMDVGDLNLAIEFANEIIETVCPGYFEYPF